MSQRAQARQFRGVYTEIASGNTTTDVASIASGAQAAVTVTVPGVSLDGRWHVLSVGSTANPGALGISAHVTAADTVVIYLQNNSGGAIDPASQTYYVVCGHIERVLTL